MKRGLTILCCFLLMCSLAGCGREDPYRVDTVVRIPVDPTDASVAQTEDPTEPLAETAEPTEEMTEAATEEATEETKTSGSSGGRKPSSGGNKKPSGEKETEPAQTEPAATEPTATEPVVTEPENTEPTEPDPTEPETTEPVENYDPSAYAVGSLEYAILAEINSYRADAGLAELTLSTRLSGIAAIRAEEVSRVWSHTRPDGRYYTSAMTDYGYGFSLSAENLIYASGSGDAAAMVAKWMSADNKDSLLNPDFTTAGIGIYRADGVTYVSNILIG